MSYRSIIAIMPKTSVDPDAQAFITAAGITNPTQQTAINTLVVSLKANGIWTKMKAIYPMVGGTATSHKFNLKDPRDLDVAFRLSFVGGVTHNSNGITVNGVNGYCQTWINNGSTINITATNSGYGIYSRTENTVAGDDIGYFNSPAMYVRFVNNLTYMRGISASPDNFNNGTSLGLFHMYGKTSASTGFWNNTKKLTGGIGTKDSPSAYSGGVLIGRGTGGFSNRNYSLAFFSESFSDTEASNLYTAVQAFQTTLGRQV